MTLQTAAETLVTQIEAACQWERDLGEDIARTRARRTQLTKSLMHMLDVLEPSARPAIDARVSAALARLDPPTRSGGPPSDKVDAVMDYLARKPAGASVAEIQRFLERQGLADYPSAAATLLSRKAKQGVVEKMGRGWYRLLA